MNTIWWFGTVCLCASLALYGAQRDRLGLMMMILGLTAWSVILVGYLLA